MWALSCAIFSEAGMVRGAPGLPIALPGLLGISCDCDTDERRVDAVGWGEGAPAADNRDAGLDAPPTLGLAVVVRVAGDGDGRPATDALPVALVRVGGAVPVDERVVAAGRLAPAALAPVLEGTTFLTVVGVVDDAGTRRAPADTPALTLLWRY